MDLIHIPIEGNVNDSLNSLRYLVQAIEGIKAGEIVEADLSKLRYLGPDGIAILAAQFLKFRLSGGELRIVLPTNPPALASFFKWSGFNHLLLGDVLPDTDHPENQTVALHRFDAARHADVQPILHLLRRFVSISDDQRIGLEIAVSETLQNVVDHACSPIGGIGCARYMNSAKELRASFVDCGMGIRNTLQQRYPDTRDDREALERVLLGGYSALSRPNNRGRGIENLRSVIAHGLHGSLIIYSGTAAVDIRASNEPRYTTSMPRFDGTIVCFTLPIGSRDDNQRCE